MESILASYRELGGINHIEGANLPSRQSVERIVEMIESLIFPGFRAEENLELSRHALRHRGKGRQRRARCSPPKWRRACGMHAGS